jgi:hypothetical protein
MAKIPQGNKFANRKFGGDDEEPQDIMVRDESLFASTKKEEIATPAPATATPDGGAAS